MAFKKFGPIRYPYTGDLYSAEGRHRIRVERGGTWGYFDDCGTWLEGEVRHAEPCMCRFASSTWVIDHAPAEYGLMAVGPHPRKSPAKAPARKVVKTTTKKAARGRSR